MTLSYKNISLRSLEPSDLDFLYSVENDESNWKISNTILPFSKFTLQEYIKVASQDIFEAKQYRFVICVNDKSIGFADLFDFDPLNKRVGIGVLIIPEEQQKGYSTSTLKILIDYCFKKLDVHQLYANILEDNIKSIHLFEKAGFTCIGNKKDWIFYNKQFHNELLYQLLRPND